MRNKRGFYFLFTIVLLLSHSSIFRAVNLKSAARNEEHEKSQFVETLLMGILQMLLGGGGGGMGEAPPKTPVEPVEVNPPEEEFQAPETTAITAGAPTPGVKPPTGTQLAGMSPESLIATALNTQQNQMGALNKQVALLEKEIKLWQDMRAKEMEAGQQKPGPENAIQLTIKYPGQAVNETNAASQEEEATKMAEEAENEMREEIVEVTGGNQVDPTKLSVPLIVVEPKMENDFHSILLKTVKEATKKGKSAALAKQMQEAILNDPKERLDIHRRLLKEAEAHGAFFRKDQEMSQNQRTVLQPIRESDF